MVSEVVFIIYGGSDLLVNDVHLEDSGFVVCKHSAVKEKLGQCKIDHPAVLSDDWINGIVLQCVILIREVEEHPLQTQHITVLTTQKHNSK